MIEQAFKAVPISPARGAWARERRPRGRSRRRRSNLLTYLGLFAAAAFALLPIIWGLSTSLKSESAVLSDSGWLPAAITLENYRLVLFESKIPVYIGNSILVAGLTVISAVVIA